jgi:hypothetical protein
MFQKPQMRIPATPGHVHTQTEYQWEGLNLVWFGLVVTVRNLKQDREWCQDTFYVILYSDSNRDNLKLLKPSKELIKYGEVIQIFVVEDVCKEQI